MGRSLLLWLVVEGWPWAPYLAAKVATGKTLLKPPEHYVVSGGEGGPAYWDAVGWAVQAVDTPCGPRQGYEGLLEHVTVRFVARCSRICTHELVRHRLASYSQTSTRLGGFHATGYGEAVEAFCRGELGLERLCVIPMGGGYVEERCRSYLVKLCDLLSRGEGKQVDDILRYAQPDALAAHIMATTNLREVLHMASLRLHPHAHWEIRRLAEELLERMWREHRVPAHLMLALKRPGLLEARRDLWPLAEEQLEWLHRGNPGAAEKMEKLIAGAISFLQEPLQGTA